MALDDYGRDRYEYMRGERYRTATGVTKKPEPGESAAAFEWRMDHLARQFGAIADVHKVELEFERRDGRIVLCLILTTHDPVLAPIGDDLRIVGHRATPRGSRGGGRAAA